MSEVIGTNTTAIATAQKGSGFSLKNLNLNKNFPGITIAATGTKLSRFPFPKVKFEEGRRLRLSILTDDVIMLKLHYHPEVGYIICDGGACCKKCDKVSIKYCYPCVVYETNEAGKPISNKVDLRLLVVGGEMYDQISLLAEVSGSLTGSDIIFTCTSTQYQKCQATVAGTASWQSSPDTVSFVQEYMTNNCDKMLDALGRTYTEDELNTKLGTVTGNSQDQSCLPTEALNDIYNSANENPFY